MVKNSQRSYSLPLNEVGRVSGDGRQPRTPLYQSSDCVINNSKKRSALKAVLTKKLWRGLSKTKISDAAMNSCTPKGEQAQVVRTAHTLHSCTGNLTIEDLLDTAYLAEELLPIPIVVTQSDHDRWMLDGIVDIIDSFCLLCKIGLTSHRTFCNSCEKKHFYDIVYVKPAGIVPVVSTLNGNNGSWTNTDDLDQAARQRRGREAHNRVHQGQGGNGRVAFGPPIGIPRRLPVAPIVEQREIFGTVLTTHPEFDWLWDGKYFYHRHEWAGHVVEPLVRLVGVKNRMPGYTEVDSDVGNTKTEFPLPCFGELSIPAYRFDEFHDPVTATLFLPAWRLIVKTFGSNASKLSAYNSIANVIDKFDMPDELKHSLIRFYALWQRHEMYRAQHPDVIFLNKQTPTYYNPTHSTYFKNVAVTPGVYQHLNPFEVLSVDAEYEDYPIRNDVDIIAQNGFNEDTLQFHTEHNLGVDDRLTYWCRFQGADVDPFVQYSRNGKNASCGLKRILGARDHEDAYRGNQNQLLLVFEAMYSTHYDSYQHISEVLKTPDMNNNQQDIQDLNEDIGIQLDDEYIRRIRRFVCTQAYKLINKVNFISIQPVLDKMLDAKHWLFYKGFETYLTFMQPLLSRECNANMPHVKRKLRQQYVMGELTHDDANTMCRRLNACVKLELAKPNKAPRLFVSYGAGCMYANELPEYIKMCIDGAHTIVLGQLTAIIYIMAKPKTDTMQKIFDDLISTLQQDNTLYFAIYSDDSVVTGVVNGVQVAFNLDISSCDASNGRMIFTGIGLMLSRIHEDRAIGLLSQCMKPIHLVNPSNKGESVQIQVDGPFEGSGTCLTTVLNHYASFLICCSILSVCKEAYHTIVDVPSFKKLVVYASSLTGHKMTVDDCSDAQGIVVEKITLLKCSPLLTECGKYIPVKNIGCTLRSLGSYSGDLQPEHLGVPESVFKMLSQSEKMHRFISQVIQGNTHEPDCLIMRSLRQRFDHVSGDHIVVTHNSVQNVEINNKIIDNDPKRLEAQASVIIPTMNRSEYKISDYSLCRRYEITRDELAVLAAQCINAQMGEIMVSSALGAIYHVDYGVDRPNILA